MDLISFVPSDNPAPRLCYSRGVEQAGKGFLQFIYLSGSPPRERSGKASSSFFGPSTLCRVVAAKEDCFTGAPGNICCTDDDAETIKSRVIYE